MSGLYGSLIINISLLVLIATILTKIPFMKSVLSEEQRARVKDQLILGVIFGLFCVFSTCTGVRVDGAIQNTRVLGALAAGLLGGPVVGITAALIGAIHRFLYDIGGVTSLACTVSTLFEGVLGSVVWCICRKRQLKLNAVSLFLITAVAEMGQMIFILLISRPYETAVELVKMIALPMILVNSFGMVFFFSVFREVFTKQDLVAADKIRLALQIADQCVPYIQKNGAGETEFEKIAEIIQKFSGCIGIVILSPDKKQALNKTELVIPEEVIGELEKTGNYCVVTRKKNPNKQLRGKYLVTGAKMTRGNEIWCYLVLFFPYRVENVQSELNFTEGLAKFFSTNYELSQIEYQRKLREQAEFKALQSQINPHFLFNSLNTIACFCREKPERARELLVALSVYFRKTLNSSETYMTTVDQEIEQVKAYLMLEEARFEERLKVEIDFPEQVARQVPTLILQPIVENAVKHGAMKREVGEIVIEGKWEEEDFLIKVRDNGFGIPETVLEEFYNRKNTGKHGLINVDSRLRSIFGETYGLSIDTGKEGTTVIMRIPPQKILEQGGNYENSSS